MIDRPDPTPRQVLYALVAAGFVIVVAILTVGAAVAGLVPTWWSAVLAAGIALGGVWMTMNWRSTGRVLLIAVGLFIAWLVGTLLLVS